LYKQPYLEAENVVTALHPEHEDYLEYKGEEILPINDIVLALEGNKINEIKSGKEHNIILTDQGLLYAFGKGNFGSLGLGGTVFSPGPQQITKLRNKKIVSVSCGMFHSLALSDIGDVYSWGRGFEGQLGLL
jgi:alpha-tubulin suppressor-like RCC1 family protein